MSNQPVDTLTEIRQEIFSSADLNRIFTQARTQNPVLICASGNAGDGLIHLGAFELLQHFDLKPRVISDQQLDQVPADSTVIMVGGALIEGVWDERMRALKGFLERGGRAIFLACTLFGFNELLEKHADQLYIFTRDARSLKNAQNAGVSAYLTHDLAFALPVEFFRSLSKAGSGTLQAFRTDDERGIPEVPFGSLDLSLLWNGDLWSDRAETERRCRILGDILATFSELETDRLHLAIFGIALGLKVHLHDTAGGKISAIYNHTLCRFKNVKFNVAEDNEPGGKWQPRDQLLENARELARLRREWYEPELNRLREVAVEYERLKSEWYDPEIERLRNTVSNLQDELTKVGSAESIQELEMARSEIVRLQTRLLLATQHLDEYHRIDEFRKTEELARKNEELGPPPSPTPPVDQAELIKAPKASIFRSLKLASYALLPYNPRRREKRRRMIASIWYR